MKGPLTPSLLIHNIKIQMTGVMWRKLLRRIGAAIQNRTGVFPDKLKDRLASPYDGFKPN